MALASDEQKSSLDILAEGSLSDQLNEEPEKVEEATPVVDEKEQAREARFEKLEKALLESQQEAQFMRGFIQSQSRQQQQTPPEAEEKDEEIDYDALAKDMETRGARALHEFVDKLVAKGVKTATKESGKLVDGRLGQVRAQQRQAALFTNEVQSIESEFPGFMIDEEFKAEADKEASKILEIRIGRKWQSEDDNRYYQPGDLLAAVKAVAYNRLKAGKGQQQTEPARNGNSLREITRRVPNEQLGNGNGKRVSNPKTIDDLDMTDKERTAARNVYNKLKNLNPDMPLTEERYVKSWLDGRRENEEAA